MAIANANISKHTIQYEISIIYIPNLHITLENKTIIKKTTADAL